MEIKARLGTLKDFKPGDLKSLIDFFQLDVENEPATYGQEQRREPRRTGGTDVPADSDSFVHPPQDFSGTPWATD